MHNKYVSNDKQYCLIIISIGIIRQYIYIY